MKWGRIDATTEAYEIVGVGVLVRSHNSQPSAPAFIPGVRIVDGEIVREMRAQPQLGGTRAPIKVLDEEPDW